jgi:hypothetical protein
LLLLVAFSNTYIDMRPRIALKHRITLTPHTEFSSISLQGSEPWNLSVVYVHNQSFPRSHPVSESYWFILQISFGIISSTISPVMLIYRYVCLPSTVLICTNCIFSSMPISALLKIQVFSNTDMTTSNLSSSLLHWVQPLITLKKLIPHDSNQMTYLGLFIQQ